MKTGRKIRVTVPYIEMGNTLPNSSYKGEKNDEFYNILTFHQCICRQMMMRQAFEKKVVY